MSVSPELENDDKNHTVSPSRRRPLVFGIIVAIVAIAAGIMLLRGGHASVALHSNSPESTIVGAAKITRETVSREMAFDSELRPFQEIAVHAKVAGYVESIDVDIGDRVKEGQMIATLELPEAQSDVDRAAASLRRAQEEILRAKANYDEAKVSSDRLASVAKSKPKLIAQQEIDTAEAREKSASANLSAAREQANAAEADFKKLKTMLQYARITAPFAGVITERYADRGALIQAGTSSSTQAMPLVRLSDNRRLRLVFPISVSFVANVHNGDLVRVEVPGLHKTLHAKITRTSQKVSTATRTMDAEIDIPNEDYSLIPGMYASVRVDVDTRTNALVIPVEALSRGKTPTVYVINNEGIVEERKIDLGIETPDKVEALKGVNEGDMVMIGSRSQVKPGQKVVAKLIEQNTTLITH